MIEIEKRITKYRAWNRELKTMDYDGGFLYDLSDFDIKNYKYLSLNIFINKITEELDLMQFIGRHDKNSKEIYEADIVKWKESIDESDEGFKRNDYIFGLILWDKEDCGFVILQLTKGKCIYHEKDGDCEIESDTEFYSLDGAEFDWEEVEIMGNVYENPDLYLELTKKNE